MGRDTATSTVISRLASPTRVCTNGVGEDSVTNVRFQASESDIQLLWAHTQTSSRTFQTAQFVYREKARHESFVLSLIATTNINDMDSVLV